MVKLTGNAGTGEKILNNWDDFEFELINTEFKKSKRKYWFYFTFGKQNGSVTVVAKKNDNDKWYICEDTLMQCDNFPTTLGAYKDTATFGEGLYEVGRRMLVSVDGESVEDEDEE